jgi:hypothetical protein
MEYTIKQLENIACDMGRNHCYGGSSAFRMALDFVKKNNEELYKRLLMTEIEEMGALGDLDEE